MRSINRTLTKIYIAGCIVVIFLAFGAQVLASGALGDPNEIYEGVSIGNLNVGGMSKKNANILFAEYADSLLARKVYIHVGDKEVETTCEELGFYCDTKKLVDEAFEVGKDGNIFQKYKAKNEIKEKGETIDVHFELKEKTAKKYIKEECVPLENKPKNSRLKLKKGKFIATESQNGQKIQIEDTIGALNREIASNISSERIDVDTVIKESEPEFTKEEVSKCQDLLGEYHTSYASSTAARATNVRTAAGRVNGTILYPGKTFSMIKVIKDRTEANGYKKAPEYSSGNVVEGVGGGVCQVSTTLYNAVINAELEIKERSPHSMVVSYVDVSRDAAISGTYKDFKFVNNTDVPIYIAASTDGGVISFRIYGQETRSKDRKIRFKSEKIQTIEPGADVTTVDPEKPVGYKQVTQQAHVGYQAKLWKIVTENGNKEKILVNKSYYKAEPKHVVVGGKKSVTKTPAPAKVPTATKAPAGAGTQTAPAATKKPAQSKPQAVNPQVTKAPQ